jgi:hypothetical protein
MECEVKQFKSGLLIERCLRLFPHELIVPKALLVSGCDQTPKFIELRWIHPSNQVKVLVFVYDDHIDYDATFGPDQEAGTAEQIPEWLLSRMLNFFRHDGSRTEENIEKGGE